MFLKRPLETFFEIKQRENFSRHFVEWKKQTTTHKDMFFIWQFFSSHLTDHRLRLEWRYQLTETPEYTFIFRPFRNAEYILAWTELNEIPWARETTK